MIPGNDGNNPDAMQASWLPSNIKLIANVLDLLPLACIKHSIMLQGFCGLAIGLD